MCDHNRGVVLLEDGNSKCYACNIQLDAEETSKAFDATIERLNDQIEDHERSLFGLRARYAAVKQDSEKHQSTVKQ